MIAGSGSDSVLLTDLYQLTMLQGYFDRRMERTAVFEFFVRKLPPKRNFLIAAGLEQALAFLENLRFTPEELDWISSQRSFGPSLYTISRNCVSPEPSTPWRKELCSFQMSRFFG